MSRHRRFNRKRARPQAQRALCLELEPRCLLTSILGAGLLSIDATSGDDTVSISIVDTTLTVTLNGSSDGDFDLTQITSILVNGLEGNDDLSVAGTNLPAQINGDDGNDTLTGGDGDDSILGQVGGDSIDGGSGADTLAGGDNGDTLNGGLGSDSILGELGNDSIDGGGGPDEIYGGDGSDTLSGGANGDLIQGDLGDDTLISNDGAADTVDGGDGTDTVTGDTGTDTYQNIESPAPTATVTANSNPVTSGVTTVDFGSVVQNAAGPTIVFTVKNDGADNLSVGSLTVPAGYTVVEGLSGPLAPGASDTFTLRLNTDTVGTFSGTVSFSSTDPLRNPFTFGITGVVEPIVVDEPEITVTIARPAGPIDNGNSTIEFGNRVIGSAGPTRTFRVKNDGTQPLTVGSITAPTGFTVIDPLLGPIAPGDMESFVLQMDTSTAASYDGFVSFTSNDSSESTFTFRIVGVVTTDPTPRPEITVNAIQSGQLRGVVDGFSSFSWGSAVYDARRPARTFRVTNDGSADLKLGAMSVPAGFLISDTLAGTIKAGATDTFIIALDTTSSIGAKSGQVSFTTNDSNETPFNFSISGTVTAPPASDVSASLSSGTLTVNGTSGIDTISFASSSKGITVTGNSKTVSGSPFSGVKRIVVNAGDGDDRVVIGALGLPSTLNGGNGNDTLTGGSAIDNILGQGGADVLDGGAGNDALWGGAANDKLTGGAGLDSLRGEDGNDTLLASDGVADLLVDGGPGNDTINKDRTDNATGT